MAATFRMKAAKPSKVVKPQKRSRYTTATTRNHRYQSFSERIAKLKIDPIRRRRNEEGREELAEEAETYFGRSLLEWKDLNMSSTFAAFAKDVSPYCDSLPVVLHNEDKIMDLLVTYIEKADALAMEPFLNLFSHFAHDLDTRFERHFERAVATISAVAAKHEDPAVVEWSFTCLAWLFKYLSRLLAPDLRPLYSLMSPYLGKDVQKPFIIRFAAESLSFLLRKAAATYERDPEPLDRIIHHMIQDCVDTREDRSADLYRQGIMTLLTESMRGVQLGIHSSALATMQSLLKTAETMTGKDKDVATDIVLGVLISTIHHTTPETFQPMLNIIIDHVGCHMRAEPEFICFAGKLLFTATSVRKGVRVADWKPLVAIIVSVVEQAGRLEVLEAATAYPLLSASAVAFQYSTIDALLPALSLFETIRREKWAPYFLPFCDLFSRLDKERFHDLLQPQLHKFVKQQWTSYAQEMCVFVPRLAGCGGDNLITAPQGLQDAMLDRLDVVGDDTTIHEISKLERLASAHAALLALNQLKLGEPQKQRLHSYLNTAVHQALDEGTEAVEGLRNFALGSCLEGLLDGIEEPESIVDLWPKLVSASAEFRSHAKFWANMLRYMTVCRPTDSNGPHMKVLEESLVQALPSPSHDVRQNALEVMQKLYELRGLPTPEVLSTATAIESTPISLDSSRAIAMNIRRLVPGYANASADPLMARAIPTYCFGLLHLKLSQAWEDAITALAEMCKSATGEETVIGLAQSWLEKTPDADKDDATATLLTVDSQGFQVVSDFECSNLSKLAAISKQVFEEPSGGHPSAEQQLCHDSKPTAMITHDSRAQALRVLNKIPHIAEKRSRLLVPVLLKWAGTAEAADPDEVTTQHRWSRKDQKAMLAVYAQFVNPKVLFQSSEVYVALLKLCANGDVEIQQSALKALFAWKDPAVNRYEEHLVNLLDEARFREEISIFLQDSTEVDAVRAEDHSRLMPVLLRLLYGRAVAGGKHGQGTRRKAIFVALSRFGRDVMGMFVDIAMSAVSAIVTEESVDTPPTAPARQQLGMLNMLNDLLETLGSDLEPFAPKILRNVLWCTAHASKLLEDSPPNGEPADASLLRSIRQIGFQCLVEVFTTMQKSDFADEAHFIARELVEPRLQKFAAENSQSISGMLRLFAAWSTSPRTAPYLCHSEGSAIEAIAETLRQASAKDEVRLFVLREILDNLLRDDQSGALMAPYVSSFVKSIGFLLNHQPTKEVLDTCVSSVAQLADHITDRDEAQELITVCSGLLIKPNKIVSPPTKTGLLRTVLPLIGLVDVGADSTLFEAVCGLFPRMADSKSRILLSDVLLKLCAADPALAKSAEICQKLNAYSGLSNEPDHGQREIGYTTIYEQWKALSAQQWLPIIQNCLFFIRDEDDMANRTSAAQALERFIEAASEQPENLIPLISKTLMSGIERGMRERSELVRAEYLRLFGQLVEKLPDWQVVSDLKCLTVSGDDEASVFTNLLHIQQHRRLRALRRVAEEAQQISSSNATKIFIPLLEHFVFDPAEGDAGRTLADQTVVTLGAIAKCLKWAAFRSTFKQYTGFISSKEGREKTVLRLLGVLVDALAVSPSQTPADGESSAQASKATVIIREFLPPLLAYLHQKDESTVDRRMPVAVTVVKLLLILPKPEMSARLPAVLTDVSHVLRSRSQEARDQTRKTLAAVLTLIGPAYLGFMLKELRSALQRGYQLHVLSFTVHSLLVRVTEVCQPGELDHCLPDVTAVIMDDIFGITGQEKDAEEYKSGMKEVKSSKSFDTMELMARVTPVNKLGLLIRPLRAMLTEKLDSKAVKKVDDLLVRLRKGIDQNRAADNRDMLVFCHEIVRQVYAEQNALAVKGAVQDYKVRKYLIQMEAANKKTRGATTSHMFKLVSFALNLVRRVVRRHEDLQTPSNMAGFLPMIGDALVQGQEEVKLAAIKLLAAVIRVPLPGLDTNAPLYLKEAVGLIKAAPSMTSDSAKAALELITAVLREKRSVPVKEADIAHVIKALKPDIDEPDRQGVIYKFLRAVLGRKIVITEVYETMDEVGKVLVTNPDRNVRESARSAYLQFVLDYPQGKDRWNKQASFFVENLRYQHSAGRQSVMELLHQLLIKLSDEVLPQLAFTFFVALVPVQISDADPACRQMAGVLIAKLFERADAVQLKSFLSLLDKWLDNDTKPMIQVASLQCWATYMRTRPVPKKQQHEVRDRIARLLTSEDAVVGAQLLQALLDTFTVMVEAAADTAYAAPSAAIWANVHLCLVAASADVQETAAKLIGAYFSHLASSTSKAGEGLTAMPLRGSGGLELDADGMRTVCRTSLRALRTTSHTTTESLTAQTVRNLAFLGRCFAANVMLWHTDEAESEDDNDDDGEVPEEVEAEDATVVQKRGSSALAYLLNRLSYIIRQDTLAVTARTAALQCQATLITQLPDDTDIPNLQSVLRPLYSLTDPAIPQPQTAAHGALVDKARELLDLVQKTVGSERYVAALGETRKEARAKREERRQKRKIDAVSAPERWAREKKRKHEATRARNKGKGEEMRGKRRGW
ncbi:hypothetical protein LTR36_000782 [Oleoguttula mirabilis]|uniref:Uncharacterized protein n=1 Tax=Oleoguttula mirabilis TaxID=1507867 RepID=A0AAV9J4Y2_9PEZI|nr:hypothetical protein LTR36_000782 [Oleoguttula mirabilis]